MAHTPHTWTNGDVVSAAILNALETDLTAAASADNLIDGTTNKAYLATERTKLAGIATGATANRADSTVDGLLAAKADLVGGLIPTGQIPAIALTNAVTVASQAAMLALTTTQVQPGDVAVRTDGAGTFILTATDPTQLGNWVRLNAPTDAVTSVNGQSGTVVLTAANVGADAAGAAAAVTPTTLGLGNVTNTSDANKPVSTAQAAAIAAATLGGPTNTLTTTGTLAAGVPNTVDATGGTFTATLPTPTKVGQLLHVEKIDTSTNAVTLSGTIRGSVTTLTLNGVGVAFESLLFEAESLTSWRPVAGHKTKAWLDALYDAKGAAAATQLVTRTQQAGTTYTFALADANTEVEAANASATTFTVPLNATVAFPVGTVISVLQYGAGQVTIAGAGGVTLHSRGSALKTYGQYSEVVLTKRSTDEWIVSGDLTT